LKTKKKSGPKKGAKYKTRFEPNWDDVKKLAHIQCTTYEIASFLDTSVDTMNYRSKENFGRTFAEMVKEWALSGRCSLRRMQWKIAERSATMAIFLGKNMLGQADKVDLGDDSKKLIRDFMMEQAHDYNKKIMQENPLDHIDESELC